MVFSEYLGPYMTNESLNERIRLIICNGLGVNPVTHSYKFIAEDIVAAMGDAATRKDAEHNGHGPEVCVRNPSPATDTSNDARHTKITQDKPPANDGYPVQGVFGGGNTLDALISRLQCGDTLHQEAASALDIMQEHHNQHHTANFGQFSIDATTASSCARPQGDDVNDKNVADMVVTGGNAPFDTLIQEIEITLDYYRTEFPKTSEHNKQVWADPIDVHACGVSADDLEQIKTILQQRELPVVTVDAHVEFWKAEYKRLACAGVERMAELGYKVAPAEKMIEAAEYREKKILGSPYPKREQGGLNFDDIETRLHAERDRLISHNISWDVADVMNVLRMNAPKREIANDRACGLQPASGQKDAHRAD